MNIKQKKPKVIIMVFTLVIPFFILLNGQDDKSKALKFMLKADSVFKAAVLSEAVDQDTPKSIIQFHESLELLDEVIKADSNYYSAYSKKQGIYAKLGEFENAYRVSEFLIKIKGIYPEVLMGQGLMLHKLKREKEAKEKFKLALKLYDDKIALKKSVNFSDEINKTFTLSYLYGKEIGLKKLKELENKFPDMLFDITNIYRPAMENDSLRYIYP